MCEGCRQGDALLGKSISFGNLPLELKMARMKIKMSL